MDYDALKGTHDLRLGDWGPYSKKYIGLSHIADRERGVRFDLCAAPGLYRRKTVLPNVRWECGYHPWAVSADLATFVHRHELEWKDQVFCDIGFAPVRDDLRLMRCRMVNHTGTPQNLTLHLIASLHYPPQVPAQAQLPEGAFWVDALEWTRLQYAVRRPGDSLAWDAQRRGQFRSSGFVGGSGIGANLGRDSGDRIEFAFSLPQELPDAGLLLRYRMAEGERLELVVDGAFEQACVLQGTGELATLLLKSGRASLSAGKHELRLIFSGGAGVDLDGFAVGPHGRLGACAFPPAPCERRPALTHGGDTLLLDYPGLPQAYGLWWSEGDCVIREHCMDDLETLFYNNIHNHVSNTFYGKGDGHYAEVFLRPLVLEPQSEKIVYALVAQGESEEAVRLLSSVDRAAAALEECWRRAEATLILPEGNDDGKPLAQGQQLMAATVLANCVYPAYAKGKHIRHHSPGRWWDSLYTWDSGFIGLGLLELDLDRAIDNLNAYVTEPGDEECAFVFHGSPVPVQHYLLLELWNRTCDREMLAYFYPRLKQYHEFLAGRLGSSDTRLPSGLLATWSYFYNSGGWDDYPPQHYFHTNRKSLEGIAAPAVNTAHALRTAKILIAAAQELGREEDIAAYRADIETFSRALETLSWDAEAGYYGYVLHDHAQKPRGWLRHPSGANFNMGLDGLSPLIADACPPERLPRLYEKLSSPRHLWTPIGLSTVDQSAPYYRRDGYWNGAVWMPHQWFFWKAALDHGQGDFAWQVADTALRLWAAETGNSYNCFEHFIIASRRGAGWHQFGGLSTPVLSWFGAYYRPGRLTGGLNCWVRELAFGDGNRSCRARLQLDGAAGAECRVLVTLAPGAYEAFWNGAPVAVCSRTAGCREITLPSQGNGLLEVRSV